MRISIISGDPGCDTWHALSPEQRMGTQIFLDGVKLRDVLTADEEQGYVLRDARDEVGHLRVDKEKQELVREEVRGVVRIVVPSVDGGAGL